MTRSLAFVFFTMISLNFSLGYAVNQSSKKIDLPQWQEIEGIRSLLAESHDTPLVTIMIAFPAGAYYDPDGQPGLANVFSSMLTRGTTHHTRQQIEDELDRLGAVLTMDTGYHSLVLRGQVLHRNFTPFFELLKDILQNPSFPEKELKKLKDEILASFKLRLEDDKRLARTHFTEAVFGNHPYAKEVDGTPQSIPRIEVRHLQEFYRQFLVHTGMVVGAAGEMDPTLFRKSVKEIKALLPEGSSHKKVVPFHPAAQKGRQVILVDKPKRTQTQFYIGHPSIALSDVDRTALSIFLTAFGGGIFQAKYMQEIRVKRGWSYGASASLDTRRDGGNFSMYTFPAVKDTIPAISLSLQLLDQAVNGDLLSDSDIEFAKQYLTGSFPFKLDTPISIVMQKINNYFSDLPDDHIETYLQRVSEVTPQMARAAAKRHLQTKNVDIVVLCTAKDLKADIQKAIGAQSVKVVPYDK